MTTVHSRTSSNHAPGVGEDGGQSESSGEGGDTEGRYARPFIVEFAGTPRAGKTTTIRGLERRLAKQGLRVRVIEEQARDCPVPVKVDPDFNLWTFAMTMAKMVDAAYTRADVVLVDRGLFDALAWMEWFRGQEVLDEDQHEPIDRFLRSLTHGKVDLVLVMTVDPDVALERERIDGGRGTPGLIINRGTLHTINQAIGKVRSRSNGDLPLKHFDTSRNNHEETLDLVSEVVELGLSDRQALPYLTH